MAKRVRSTPDRASAGEADAAGEEKRRLAAYNAVADKAALGTIRLVELTFKTNAEFFSQISDKAPKLSYSIVAISADFNAEMGAAGAFFSCEVTSKVQRRFGVICRAKYFVGYQNLIGCDESAAKAFVARVGRFTCYPYFRALMAQLDWNAGSSLPMLPVLRNPIPGVRNNPGD